MGYSDQSSASNDGFSTLSLFFIVITMTIAICAVFAKITQKWKAINDSNDEKGDEEDIEHRASCASDIEKNVFDALSHIDAQYPGNSHKSAPSTGYRLFWIRPF